MKKQIKITKDNIIRKIAENTNENICDVKVFYNALENIIFQTLCSVDEKQDICIKMFEGINIDGIYIPERTKTNNLTGKTNLVKSKIKPKFNITRSYCEKLNNKQSDIFSGNTVYI